MLIFGGFEFSLPIWIRADHEFDVSFESATRAAATLFPRRTYGLAEFRHVFIVGSVSSRRFFFRSGGTFGSGRVKRERYQDGVGEVLFTGGRPPRKRPKSALHLASGMRPGRYSLARMRSRANTRARFCCRVGNSICHCGSGFSIVPPNFCRVVAFFFIQFLCL